MKELAFVVKSTGGIASQLLSLLNALYLKNRDQRPFRYKHYKFGTGVCYPFGISSLLEPDEISDYSIDYVHQGYSESEDIPAGKIVENGPLQRVSFEKLYGKLRGTPLDCQIKWMIRREWSVLADQNRFMSTPQGFQSINGGFVPIENEDAHSQLKSRFDLTDFPNPYFGIQQNKIEERTIVHYRIGDLRSFFALPTTPGAGILNPTSYKNIILSLPVKTKELRVVSENPKLAKELLESVEVRAKSAIEEQSIWDDLVDMCSARYLIGSWSALSMFAASIRSRYGLSTYFPTQDSMGTQSRWRIKHVINYDAKYLPPKHWIYDVRANNSELPKYVGY